MQLASRCTRLLVDRYFDSENAELVDMNVVIDVSPDTGLIHDILIVTDFEQAASSEVLDVIDLRGRTVLPGFVDTHVHFFLHPYSETPWEDQLTRESLVERTVRAVHHARKTLLAGFTTVRDLGTEGAGDADIALRECISSSKSLTPGPRYFVANRALVTSGSYGPKSSLLPHSEGVAGILGAQVVDGVDECSKAVRQQIGAGADWQVVLRWSSEFLYNVFTNGDVLVEQNAGQVYADYQSRSRIGSVASKIASQSLPLFNKEELRTIIETAHGSGVKVAAHSNNNDAIDMLISLGIDSIEHAFSMDDQILGRLRDAGVIWNPTLGAYYSHPLRGDRWDKARATFGKALNLNGLKFACGGDTGVFAHGDNALELKLMVAAGANWNTVLQAATLHGWQCVRSQSWEGSSGQIRLAKVHLLEEDQRLVGDNEMPFGIIQKGFAADLIATAGSLQERFSEAVSPQKIVFVMKGGVVYKSEGRSTGH